MLRAGSDVYADDVVRLVMRRKRTGWCPTATPGCTPPACSAPCRRSAMHCAAGNLDVEVHELAAFVGDWVVRALAGEPAVVPRT